VILTQPFAFFSGLITLNLIDVKQFIRTHVFLWLQSFLGNLLRIDAALHWTILNRKEVAKLLPKLTIRIPAARSVAE
jgi:hypothetical protein